MITIASENYNISWYN